MDNNTLEWAAQWIEGSLKGETDQRVIEFGKNIAMTLRASSLPNETESSSSSSPDTAELPSTVWLKRKEIHGHNTIVESTDDDAVQFARVHPRSKGGKGFPLGTLQLLQRRVEKIRSCPCAVCSECIEILCSDVIPIVDSVIDRYTRTPPQVEGEAAWRPMLKHVLICSGSPDDCDTCREAADLCQN